MSKAALAKEDAHADFEDVEEEAKDGGVAALARGSTPVASGSTPLPLVVGAWLVVGVPLAWGVWITLQKAVILFH